MSWPGCSFRRRIAAIGSPLITVVLFHSGSVSVLETTYLAMLFIRSLNGSPDLAIHAAENAVGTPADQHRVAAEQQLSLHLQAGAVALDTVLALEPAGVSAGLHLVTWLPPGLDEDHRGRRGGRGPVATGSAGESPSHSVGTARSCGKWANGTIWCVVSDCSSVSGSNASRWR